MSMDSASKSEDFGRFAQLRYGREVIRSEARALLGLADRLNDEFCEAIDLLSQCQGNVLVSGMGKAGLIGQKIAATLASTGTPSHFLHPSEAIHGDLGRVQADDVLILLSFSGETAEIVTLADALGTLNAKYVAITGRMSSRLASQAARTIDLGPINEACSLGLAPTTSTAAMLAVGDAIALVLSRKQDFGPLDFARYHPGGSLGRKLAKVEDAMRPLVECRVADQNLTIREILVQQGRPGRRTGAIMALGDGQALCGIFTDSDLARLLESRRDRAIDGPLSSVMTCDPLRVVAGSRLTAAVELMTQKKISELPVVDVDAKPIGMIDITDVVGILPAADNRVESTPGDDDSMESLDEHPPIVPFPAAE